MDVLFDLDGTLVDTRPGIIGSFQHALRALALPVPDRATMTDVIGPPLRVCFPKYGVASGDVERAVALYREVYSGGVTGGAPLMLDCAVYDGIPAVLTSLTQAGCRLLVATSKPHVYARPILRAMGLADHFAAIHGAELDGRRDDKTELIAHIIATEGVDPTAAVMIGDRRFDMLGARENGIRAIGATWGYGTMAELRDAGASAICPQPRGLHRLVLWLLTGHG